MTGHQPLPQSPVCQLLLSASFTPHKLSILTSITPSFATPTNSQTRRPKSAQIELLQRSLQCCQCTDSIFFLLTMCVLVCRDCGGVVFLFFTSFPALVLFVLSAKRESSLSQHDNHLALCLIIPLVMSQCLRTNYSRYFSMTAYLFRLFHLSCFIFVISSE